MLVTPSPLPSPSGLKLPGPSPSPTEVLHVIVESSSGRTDVWLIVVPLLVSLVALGGAIFTAWHTGRKTIEAENTRAENAIHAETLRAKAAIAAEDRRHANQLAHENIAWLLTAKKDAYVSILRSTDDAVFAVHQLNWFLRPSSDTSPYSPAAPERAEEMRSLWNKATANMSSARTLSRAVGGAEIVRLSQKVIRLTGDALQAIKDVRAEEQRSGSHGRPYREVAKDERSAAQKAALALAAAIRADLGTDPLSAEELAGIATEATSISAGLGVGSDERLEHGPSEGNSGHDD